MQTDAQLGYSHSVPLSWLQCPEDRDRSSLLEFSRGTLYGLSGSADGRFNAVHVSRIQHSFKKLGAPGMYRVGLRLLQLLREVEPLFGGYWLPTPFRVVEVANEFAFVGAIPTTFGFLGEVHGRGISRLLTRDAADQFPRQSIEGWMGVANKSPANVVADLTENHARLATRTLNLVGTECLSLQPGRFGTPPHLQWRSEFLPTLPAEQIAVCRQLSRGRMRYFSAGVVGQRVSTEAPIDMPIARLMFAISHRLGAPVKVQVMDGPAETKITVQDRLPIEEFRLAFLLATEIIRSGRVTTFVLPSNFADVLCTRLSVLGCALEKTQ